MTKQDGHTMTKQAQTQNTIYNLQFFIIPPQTKIKREKIFYGRTIYNTTTQTLICFSMEGQFTIFIFQYQHNHWLQDKIFSMEGQFTIPALKP